MIAMAPGDDAWGFLVPVYHYQAGRERERGGAADPCPPSLSGNVLPRPGSRPLSTRFQEKPGRPLSTGGMPTPVYFRKSRFRKSGWLACVYTRARMRIYMYIGSKSLIYNDIHRVIISSRLVKNY